MIDLRPRIDIELACPNCDRMLDPRGWRIPGMRTVADLECPGCGRTFYGDLPCGHGLLYPALVDRTTGEVHDPFGGPWFAHWLRESWSTRHSTAWPVAVENVRPIRRPLLLDCLDGLYGHSLLKLLNAQHHLDHRPELDLLVIVPQNLRWLVPDGAAEIWTVEVSPSESRGWNDWFADTIAERVEDFSEVWLSTAVPHPDPRDYDIERFTRTTPRPLEVHEPGIAAITYAWRSDRSWRPCAAGWSERRAVTLLAGGLRKRLGEVDFAICGIGKPLGIDGAMDLRHPTPDSDVERAWCRRYASSDVVLGVHGSNMLLPSAHAYAAVELVPEDRLGNVAQSLLVRGEDPRDILYRHRLLAASSSPRQVAAVIEHIIRWRAGPSATFNRTWTSHESLRGDLSGPRRTRLEGMGRGSSA